MLERTPSPRVLENPPKGQWELGVVLIGNGSKSKLFMVVCPVNLGEEIEPKDTAAKLEPLSHPYKSMSHRTHSHGLVSICVSSSRKKKKHSKKIAKMMFQHHPQ